MLKSYVCPSCGEVNEYASQKPLACEHCGAQQAHSVSHLQKNEWTSFKWFLSAFVFLALSMFHIANWNEYSLTIIPLKMADFFEYASVDDMLTLDKICEARKKLECQEQSLQKLNRMEPKKRIHLENLAKVQKKMNTSNILITYLKYISFKKNLKTETLHVFALALESHKKKNESLELYTMILNDKKYKHKASATRSYVSLLMSQKKLTQAKRTILRFRRKNKGAQLFLKKELSSINRHLASTRM